jgi:hypothetical protein
MEPEVCPPGNVCKIITKKQTMGWVDYYMHKERQMCYMVWTDKQLVVLLSTQAKFNPKPGI